MYAAFVTGVVSMWNGGTRQVCAGRSLSRAHGSAVVPIVNGPPGTRTSAGPSYGRARGSGSGAVSAAPPFLS